MAFTLRVRGVLGRSACRIVWVGAAVFAGRRVAVGMYRRTGSDANGPASGNARSSTGHQYPYADTGSANIHASANADPNADPNANAKAGAGWRSRDT